MLGPCVLALSLVEGGGASRTLIDEGDARYARRAEGAHRGSAAPGPAEAALVAYRRAVALDPSSIEARWKVLRALFFRASFCGAEVGERRRILEEARRLGDEAVARLEEHVGHRRGPERIAALGEIREAPLLYFWTAVAWGEWALARGKFAAAGQGAGPKIRDLAQTVVDLDPEMEQGGGYRILGRLHDQSPRIPLLTGWVSREKALLYLRKALALGPKNTVNQLFLAQAILDHDPSRKEEARRLLLECASAPPRPEYLVEDAYYAEQSRTLLAKMR